MYKIGLGSIELRMKMTREFRWLELSNLKNYTTKKGYLSRTANIRASKKTKYKGLSKAVNFREIYVSSKNLDTDFILLDAPSPAREKTMDLPPQEVS